MAYIKIFPIKVTDKKALDYIMNPEKTEEKLLISSFACSPESADLEFAFTREEGKKNVMDKGNNLTFHLIQSFKPGEVNAETAHKLGKEFADKVLKGKYEYVISTHVDQNYIHNHIIFNTTSFVDHHKYVSNKRSYHKICRISNRICQENGLVTSMPTGEKGKSAGLFIYISGTGISHPSPNTPVGASLLCRSKSSALLLSYEILKSYPSPSSDILPGKENTFGEKCTVPWKQLTLSFKTPAVLMFSCPSFISGFDKSNLFIEIPR